MNEEFRGKKISYRRGYPIVYDPKHHKASKNGMVEIHYIIAEEQLGRPLRKNEEVHHRDENKCNYNSANLMVFDTKSSHATYHTCMKHNSNMLLTRIDGVWHCQNMRPEYNHGKMENENLWICPICGGPMKFRYAHMCKLCSMRKQSENIPSKDVLIYDLKSLSSFCAVGRKYNVSDNAVRRWCKKYGLPYHSHDYKSVPIV